MQLYRNKNIDIYVNDDCVYPTEYLERREEVWKQEVEASNKRGLKIWNSKVYNLVSAKEKSDVIRLDINMIEYKDLVYQISQGRNGYVNELKICPLAVNIIIINKEGGPVIGRRSSQNYSSVGKYCFAGGSLNDEIELLGFSDVKYLAEKELEEEFHKGDINIEDYLGLFCNSRYAVFLFKYNCGLTEKEILKLPGTQEMIDYKSLSLKNLEQTQFDLAYYMNSIFECICAEDLL